MDCIEKNLLSKNDHERTIEMILKDMFMNQGAIVIGKYITGVLKQIELVVVSGKSDHSIDSSVSRLVRLLTGQSLECAVYGSCGGLLARLDYNKYYSIGNGQ